MSYVNDLRNAERTALDLREMGYSEEEAVDEAAATWSVEPGDLQDALENPPERDYDIDWWEHAR